jgi:hypothetical protein
MKRRISETEYTEKEKEDRLHAALRGARIAGHKPMEDLIKKKPKAKKAAKKRKSKKPTA